MGKATILVNRMLLASLLFSHKDQITIESASKWGENEDDYFCEIASPLLRAGNNGHQDLIRDGWELRFKQDLDV